MWNRTIRFMLCALLLTGGTQGMSAQSWLKKIGKAIDNGAKTLDKVNRGLGEVMEVVGITPADSTQAPQGQEQADRQTPDQASGQNAQRDRNQTSQQTTTVKGSRKSSIFQSGNALQGAKSYANGAAVIATDPNSVGVQLNKVTIEATVTMQLPTAGSGSYACLALMSNYQWNANSLDDILTLADKLCFGEQLLASSKGQQRTTVSIPIEKSGFPGVTEHIYVQAYLVDIQTKKLLAKGDFVMVDENKIQQQVQGW